MILTSTIEQKQQLIDIFTTELKQAKAELKQLKTIETKISQTVKTLQPILDQYPESLKVIADKLGLLLPEPETTSKPRVIPIEGDELTIKPIIIVNNNNTSPQPKNNNILVEKLQELAQLGPKHNLTININPEKLTAEVLAPHPKSEKPYPVVNLSIRSLELSEGWMWLYDINIKGNNHHNICYTGLPADFAEVISNAAKYYFDKPVTQLINKVTSDFPRDWKQDKNTNLWRKILTEKDSEQLTQNTNNFTGIVELKTGFYQWNFQPETRILTLQENNNDTTSDNNAETDSTDTDKSGDVSTPPTSNMGDIKDTDIANIPTITWYSSSNGEVELGSKKRYFRLVLDTSTNTHEIKFKKSIDSGKWIQPSKSTEMFASAIFQEFKAGKADAAEAILQKIYEVAEELGGKLIRCSGSYEVGHFGTLYVPNESIEVGYNDGSWWFIRPGCNKVYCSGDVQAFAEILKGLKAEESPYSNEVEIAKIATAFDKIKNANEPNTTNTKSSDCWYTPPQIVELVEVVLETIDLDPCSDDEKHIPATTHYTKKDNGLACIWQGKVFMNPPYSCPGKWIEKLISEIDSGRVTEAIALLPASTDTKWFQPLWSQPICFWKGRIKFLDTNYQPKLPARQSHCLVYWGENIEKFQQIFSEYGEITLPKETQETSTLFNKIKPYIPETWVLENNFFDQITIRENTHINSNYVRLTDCLNGEINIHHNRKLLYTVQSQDIETVIDLIYWWFEQQNSLKTPSSSPKYNHNNDRKIESTVESESVEKTLTLTEKITPLLQENWLIKTINDHQVLICSSGNKNSDWVKVTDISYTEHGKNFPFTVAHNTNFINDAKTIEEVIEKTTNWFDCRVDILDVFIEIINSYSTDLTILKNDSSTAYIQIGQERLGTVFFKDNEILEVAEREKQLLKELYSIALDELIQDINNKEIEIIDEELINSYLMGIDSLDEELNPLDTLQNALHSLSNKFISNKLNLEVIRQGKTFKLYNGSEWLENYLGSIHVNDAEIIADEELIDELLNNYSILLNQLTSNIVKGETEIEIENYIINSEKLKQLLSSKTWNEADFESANNLLNELVESSPVSNQLIEAIDQQRQILIDSKKSDNDDDNRPNNGGSKTPPNTPKNPNNNGGQKVTDSDTEELNTLESAFQRYNTDLKMQKIHNKITFFEGKYKLGNVEQNKDKLVAENKLISNLKVSYGIDLKGLIESIEYASIDNFFELDPFEHITSNALKTLGCVVAPISKTQHNRRGMLLKVNGELATIQWLDYGVRGDNSIEQVNINQLRYVGARPLTNSNQNNATLRDMKRHIETESALLTLSDELTTESFAALKFGGLIAATNINNTDTNKENPEFVENTTASDIPNDYENLIWEDLTWMDAIKVKVEKLEGFKVNHDEVDLTVTHYGTNVGSIHHNQDNELEIEQKLIAELAKYDFNLEAFLVALDIPYKFYHLKPVIVTPTTERSDIQTSEQESITDSKMTKKPPVDELNYQVNGKSISFGLTLPQLLLGQKTVTRRVWKDNYVKRFLDDWNARPGEFIYPALTKSYRVGGKKVGHIRITHKPYQEKLADMPSNELAAEGFPELSKEDFINKFFDGDDQQIVWVIRFEFIPNPAKNQELSTPDSVALTQDSTKNQKPSTPDNVTSLQEGNLTPTQNSTENKHTTDLLDKLAQTFNGFNDIRTKHFGDALWFYQGEETLQPCYLKQLDQEMTLLPSLELEVAMEKMFGIDIAKVCFDIESGLSVDINNYVNQSIWNETITNSTDIERTETSQKTNTNEVLSDEKLSDNTDELRWVKEDSMYARTETYIVWKGSQKCGKINKYVAKKSSKRKANNGKWYLAHNVLGPYYDTIEEAAQACWQQL